MTDLTETIADPRAAVVFTHELVGIDANGKLCSCGEHCPSWLEHLGDVAVEALGVGRFKGFAQSGKYVAPPRLEVDPRRAAA